MDDNELIKALRRLVCRDSLQCLGCGHEHRCSTHGCAIIRQAVERLKQSPNPGRSRRRLEPETGGEDDMKISCSRCGADEEFRYSAGNVLCAVYTKGWNS